MLQQPFESLFFTHPVLAGCATPVSNLVPGVRMLVKTVKSFIFVNKLCLLWIWLFLYSKFEEISLLNYLISSLNWIRKNNNKKIEKKNTLLIFVDDLFSRSRSPVRDPPPPLADSIHLNPDDLVKADINRFLAWLLAPK